MSSAGVLRYSLVPLLALFSFGFTDDSTAGGERKNVFLGQDQRHEGWYFAAGDRVTIAGTVTGDAYVAGGVVEISGTVMGDLIAAGGTVKVSGRVEQDVRAAGSPSRVPSWTRCPTRNSARALPRSPCMPA